MRRRNKLTLNSLQKLKLKICLDYHVNKLSLPEIREKYGFSYFWEIRSLIKDAMKDKFIEARVLSKSKTKHNSPIKTIGIEFGSKEEPYYDSSFEEMDIWIIPKYKYEELSFSERDLYERENKKKEKNAKRLSRNKLSSKHSKH